MRAFAFGSLKVAKLMLLKECLVQMGLTPASRSKIHIDSQKDDNKEDEFAEFERSARPSGAKVH
jgi:phage terminase small subunit